MTDENYIPIVQAAYKSQLNKEFIAELIEKKEVSSRIIDGTIYVDYSEIERYIQARSRLSIYREFEEEVNILLSFTPNSSPPKTLLKELTPKNSKVYKLIVTELSFLIQAKMLRGIFVEKCFGKTSQELSSIYNLTPQQISNLYEKALNVVGKNIGITKRHAIQNEELKLELRRQQIRHNTYLNELRIKSLDSKDYKAMLSKREEYAKNSHQHSPDISQELILKLGENLTDWDITKRLENVFSFLKLNTTEDLLRFIKENGIRKFIGQQNCGKKTFKELTDILLEKELIYENFDSPYFKYI